MEEYYRGDTFIFPFELQDEDENKLQFETGNKVILGVKKNISDKEYALYQEIVIDENLDEIQIKFQPEETKKLDICKYIVELQLEHNNLTDTIYQDFIVVKGDVINDSNS